MQIERRALTSQESAAVYLDGSGRIMWDTVLVFPLLLGTPLGALVLLFIAILEALAGFDLAQSLGLHRLWFGSALWGLMVLGACGYFLQQSIRVARRQKRETAELFSRDDFIVELHRVADCKLVREPEHGQPIFFVRTADDWIIPIVEGLEPVDEDWERDPLKLGDYEIPRERLKVIRHPETNECLFLRFVGDAIPARECFLIRTGPRRWPESGDRITASWHDLEKAYELVPIKIPAG